MIELHHLRHFVAVGDDLHFGKAAIRLNMAQPALSQSIKRLEASLGIRLLERNNRHVALTAAGRVFLDEARKALDQTKFAIRAARQVAAGETGELRIGTVTGALFRYLPNAVRLFRSRWPGVQLRLDERPMEEQITGLNTGDIDAAFLYTPFQGSEGLAFRTLYQYGFLAAVPETGPLAKKSRIKLADLAAEPFILFPQRQGPQMHAAIMAACQAAGFTPRITQEAQRIQTMLSLVACGLGVTLVQDSTASMQVDGVKLIPLEDMPPSLIWGLGVVWRPPLTSPVLRNFLDCVFSFGEERKVAL
jgi:DNA-binding transcriptional LysR family regulator